MSLIDEARNKINVIDEKMVELFEERMSAVGRIPGGYNRSEGKASDKAIFISSNISLAQSIERPKGKA